MAIEFDGTDDRIARATYTAANDLTTITLAAWIYIDTVAAGSGHRFFDKGSVKIWYMLNVADVGGFDKVLLLHAFSGTDGLWTTATPSYGAWHHVVVTYDNTATTNNPSIYYDGVAQTVVDFSGDPTGTADADNAGNMALGDAVAGGAPFDGKMEDFRYYGRILTAKEIALLAAGYRGPLGGEVLWYSLNDFEGVNHPHGTTLTVDTNYVTDFSANQQRGNPTNSPIARASEAPRLGIFPFFPSITGMILVSLTASISSISGSIAKNTSLVRTGAISSITGSLIKAITKTYTGAISSITGSILVTYLLTYTGAISSIAGAIATERLRIFAKIIASIAPIIGIRTKTAPATDNETKTGPTTGIEGQ